MSVEVTYFLAVDDIVAHTLYAWEHDRETQTTFRRHWILPPLLLLLFGTWLASFPETRTALSWALVAAFVLFCGYPWWHRRQQIRTARRYALSMEAAGHIGPIRLVLTEHSLTENARAVRSEVEWQDMQGMQIVGDVLYIAVTPIATAIIPRHGCQSDDDFERVRDFAAARFAEIARRNPVV